MARCCKLFIAFISLSVIFACTVLVIILVPSPFILVSVVVFVRMCLSIILRALLVTMEVGELVELSGNCG